MGAQLLMLSMVFVDSIMVGALGSDALASLALATGMYSLANIVLIGMLGAISPMITHPLGKGDHVAVGQVMRQGWLFAAVLTIVLILILWNAGPIFYALGQKPELIPAAVEYLRIMCVTAPAHMLVLGARNLTEGTGDSMAGAIIVGCAAVLNIPLDYGLINGAFGFPALGVAGAAWATAILSWFSLITMFIYLYRGKRYKRYLLWTGPWRLDWLTIKEMCRIGMPLGGAIGAEMVFFVATTFVMGTITAEALAAHQVALNAASMTFMIPLGLSFAVSIRVGHYRGFDDIAGARRAWLAGVVIALFTQTLGAIFFFAFPGWIVGLYSQTDEVARLAIELLMIAAFFQLFDGLQVVGMGALRGSKDTAFAFKSTMMAFWGCGATCVAIAYYVFDKSPHGVWIGLLIGLGSASVIHHTRMHLKTKGSVT